MIVHDSLWVEEPHREENAVKGLMCRMTAKAGHLQVPLGLPGTPYSIPFGGSFGSGFPPMQYPGKLAFQPSYEIITPKGAAGSFMETQDLGDVCSNPTAKEIVECGRDFPWPRPAVCPQCGGDPIWGHGFVTAFLMVLPNRSVCDATAARSAGAAA